MGQITSIVTLDVLNVSQPRYFNPFPSFHFSQDNKTFASLPDSPFGLGGEGLRLVVGGGGGDDLVAVLVDGASLGGSELGLLLGLLLDLGNLLALLGGSRDLHAQDDVSDLRLGEGGHIHTGEEEEEDGRWR